jgi:uncharacterized membrane protein
LSKEAKMAAILEDQSLGERRRPAGPTARQARGSSGGIGRPTSPRAEAVSDQLRRHDSDFLRGRRRAAALALGATGALGVVSAYQIGVLKHIPEPPVRLFEADKVDASGEAYVLFSMPDGILGMLSAVTTAALATMGTHDRVRRQPWLPLALAAKAGLDGVYAVLLTVEQGTKHKRFCSWCLTAAAASIATIPAVLPEARAAWRTVRS